MACKVIQLHDRRNNENERLARAECLLTGKGIPTFGVASSDCGIAEGEELLKG
jgi:hypothetical protein